MSKRHAAARPILICVAGELGFYQAKLLRGGEDNANNDGHAWVCGPAAAGICAEICGLVHRGLGSELELAAWWEIWVACAASWGHVVSWAQSAAEGHGPIVARVWIDVCGACCHRGL